MKKRKVFLTGGSRGIGLAIAGLLRKEGYNVTAPSRKELNLNSNYSIDKYIKRNQSQGFDILINNAGVNYPEWIDEVSDSNINETLQVNLAAPIRLSRGLVGAMKKKSWGRIVNISSIFGVVARGKQVLYSSTKHGLNGLTKALALELASYNILVNSVCPGFTITDLVTKRNTPEKIAALAKEIPLGRLARPEEVAQLVVFLISDKNTYITGTTIIIDGGFICR